MFQRIAGGGGYQVDAQALHGFAQAAATTGQSVDQLAGKVQAALALGVPGGLDIGVALQSAQDAWNTRLTQLASEATTLATSLTENASGYEQTEADIVAALNRGRLAA
ncbi:MAG TPA: hypothetical protein VL551_29035 [Actinospica sp.]|jgi:hypothetical protein|nr:hypothetical protein [Actinospica sp.]